ncbi:MAG: spiro-SPASM protein [Treponema sp.]|jgi:spiro-SPASM protein|nr:spiro-SPASM protein [Treponema sp.]
MNALTVLYGGSLTGAAYEACFDGRNALSLALERAASFSGVTRTVLLAGEADPFLEKALCNQEFLSNRGSEQFAIVKAKTWTQKSLLDALASLSRGYDLTYFVWADAPFLDPALADAIAARHCRYAAEYSYAEGWPYGFAPELLSPGTAGILSKILGGNDGPLERDALFQVLQKDINAFDIETEISPVDLRGYRLSLTADTRRNLLLCTRFALAAGRLAGDAGSGGQSIPRAADVQALINGGQEMLRTLPAYYNIQVSGPCPQTCSFCPYPQFGRIGEQPVTERTGFMEPGLFEELLDRIAAFSGDAVISLSLWGELGLHPQKMDLVRAVLTRPSLSLVIETSGIAWKDEELSAAAALAAEAGKGDRTIAPLSWIVSLDAKNPDHYRQVRGPGYAEAAACAKKLMELFPADTYVQALRMKGLEDEIEQFYRSWKDAGGRVIIQKYDHFCQMLPAKAASDLSPVKRRPCWHLLRDMTVLLDGQVPCCREDLGALQGRNVKSVLGNVFSESLETIWERGMAPYREHCRGEYGLLCAECDEYYTYNF